MRRNNGNRRGPMGNSAGGPLMTEHLKDIDLELELLKRKRDMIEQQQHLLAMEQQFQSSSRNYDFEPHSSNRDYTHLYDSGSKNRSQFGRKRQPEPQWQYENPSKRPPPKRKGQQPQFNPRMGQVQPRPVNAGPANFRDVRPLIQPSIGPKNFPRGAVPLMSIKVKQSVGQKIANQNPKPNPPRKQITQNKVTKPKAAPAPNKLAAQPLAERKKLVSAATEASQVDVTRMLLPDQVPTLQVSGRLELALGAIMKNIRESVINNSPHAALLRTVETQRVMKQAIRERIKTVMLGKVVGSMLEILGFYREEFPPETDVDIVNIALEAIGVLPSKKEEKKKIVGSETDNMFKMNMNHLLESHLIEMFTKLEEIYRGENPNGGEGSTELELKTGIAKDSLPNKREESEEFKQFLELTIKARDVRRYLPRLLKNFLPHIIKLLNMDKKFKYSVAALAETTNQKTGQVMNKTPVEMQAAIDPANDPANPIHPVYTLPYYAKILGRTSLPKKKMMQTFLSQFNTKSIKKHRAIHNLLFVGFSDKRDLDALLAADGTVIGRMTLSIRVCGKANENISKEPNKEIDFSLDVSQSDLKNESADSEVISAELDGQITDLLSSIRKETDDNDDKVVESTDKQDTVPEQGIQSELDDDDIVMKELDTENGGQTTETTENILEQDSNAGKDIENEQKTDEAEIQNTESADVSEKQDEEISNTTETKNPEESNDTENKSEDSSEIQPSDESTGKETVTPAVEEKETPQQSKEETTNSEAKDTSGTDKEPAEEVKVTDNNEKDEANKNDTEKAVEEIENDRVEELKSNGSGRSTPTRASARKANVTPSTIRTRRASRLAQN